MILTFSDNIIAEMTPPGRAAISALRVSGPNAKEIIEELFREKITKTRFAYYFRSELDDVVVLYYKAPNSYTGEEVCEIFCHGNPAIVNSIIDTVLLNKKFKTRIATPGEFTKRAYLNNKMDLIQAEAVTDIINSSSEIAIKYRNQTLKGNFSKVLNEIRDQLLDISVFTELEIDFEEEAAGVLDKKNALRRLEEINTRIDGIIESFSRIETLSKDINVLIVGEANVGKSSLFNKLIEQDRSIVHEYPGTTRDYIEADLFMGGLEVTLIDTAGFRKETNCEIEKMGIDKINDLIESALLLIEVTDRDDYEFKYKNSLKIRNKIDKKQPKNQQKELIYTSAMDQSTIMAFKGQIEARLKELFCVKDNRAECFLLTKRQKTILLELKTFLDGSIDSIKKETEIDIVSFMIRNAIKTINLLIGKESQSDDTLDELFSRFCIGK
ncbi:MAG: tRNA uridine-5-carboxymethylaminomethyl(34) synthesis GTPase MnmE [bacterium]